MASSEVRVAARKEVSASTAPTRLFCIRAAMEAFVDEQPSLVLLVLSTSIASAGQLSCLHGLTWIAAVVRAERSDHDGRLLEVRRSMRGICRRLP
jgi:hypothetical protein